MTYEYNFFQLLSHPPHVHQRTAYPSNKRDGAHPACGRADHDLRLGHGAKEAQVWEAGHLHTLEPQSPFISRPQTARQQNPKRQRQLRFQRQAQESEKHILHGGRRRLDPLRPAETTEALVLLQIFGFSAGLHQPDRVLFLFQHFTNPCRWSVGKQKPAN